MEKKVIMMMFLIVNSFFITSCAPAELQCSADSDCVPAQCCHAAGAVNKQNAPDCSRILCTLSCEPNSIDCGQGEVKCLSDKCGVVMNP